MAPSHWMDATFANHILTTVRVREEITAPSIVLVKRSDVPLSPAAGHLLDLMKRAAANVEAPQSNRSSVAGRRANKSRGATPQRIAKSR
jgi:LysR family transcriptional regulator, regulator of abg operon